jgi:hypothetical protein
MGIILCLLIEKQCLVNQSTAIQICPCLPTFRKSASPAENAGQAPAKDAKMRGNDD